MSLREESDWPLPQAEATDIDLLDDGDRLFLGHLVQGCKKKLADEGRFKIDPSDPVGNILGIMEAISRFEFELPLQHQKPFIAPHHAQHLRKMIVAQTESIRRSGTDIPNPFFQSLRDAYRQQFDEYGRFAPDGSDLTDAWRLAVEDVAWLESRLERPQA